MAPKSKTNHEEVDTETTETITTRKTRRQKAAQPEDTQNGETSTPLPTNYLRAALKYVKKAYDQISTEGAEKQTL